MVELRRFLTWFTQKAVATGQMFGAIYCSMDSSSFNRLSQKGNE
jgi:hypothetical protein